MLQNVHRRGRPSRGGVDRNSRQADVDLGPRVAPHTVPSLGLGIIHLFTRSEYSGLLIAFQQRRLSTSQSSSSPQELQTPLQRVQLRNNEQLPRNISDVRDAAKACSHTIRVGAPW